LEYGIARYDYREWHEYSEREKDAEQDGVQVVRSPYLEEMDKLAQANGLDWINKIHRKYIQQPETEIQDEDGE